MCECGKCGKGIRSGILMQSWKVGLYREKLSEYGFEVAEVRKLKDVEFPEGFEFPEDVFVDSDMSVMTVVTNDIFTLGHALNIAELICQASTN